MATAVQNKLPEHPAIAYGIALDPFVPNELSTPPGITANPPNCPHCTMVIHVVLQNAQGDLMFECLNQGCLGYMAVLRIGKRVWEQNPNHPHDPQWVPPGIEGNKKLAELLKGVKPVPSAKVATPPPATKTKETKHKPRRKPKTA